MEQLTQPTYCAGDLRLFGTGCALQRPFQRAPGQLRKPLGNEPFDYGCRMAVSPTPNNWTVRMSGIGRADR